MKVKWIIPGFGEPHIEKKTEILDTNIAFMGGVKPTVHTYSPDRPGVVGEFLLNKEHPHLMRDLDAVVVSLDDCELTGPVPWDYIEECFSKGWDVISPSLENTLTAFPHMVRDKLPKDTSRTSVAEFFFYVMTPRAYATWWGYIRRENPWLWGMELTMVNTMMLKVAITKRFSIIHHYAGGSRGLEGRNLHFAEVGRTLGDVAKQPCFF